MTASPGTQRLASSPASQPDCAAGSRSRRAVLATLAAGAALGLPACFALAAAAQEANEEPALLVEPPALIDEQPVDEQPVDEQPGSPCERIPEEPKEEPALADPEAPEPDPNDDGAVWRAERELLRNAWGWRGRCQAFVEYVRYGRTGLYLTAWAAAQRPTTYRMHWSEAPLGAAIYFRAAPSNGWNGHAGVKVAHPDTMISATSYGVRRGSIEQWSRTLASFYSWEA